MLTVFFAMLLAGCAAEAEQDDQCIETRTNLAFDDPGPWDTTPAEVVGHVEGVRTGTLTWLGGADAGQLEPAAGQASVSVEITLDTSSAIGVDLEHVGNGRLACIDSVEMRGSVSILSDDGALAETIEVELEAAQGDFGGQVVGHADLTSHTFAGTLDWAPSGAGEELFLRLSVVDDAPGTLRGWLIWGDAGSTTVVGDEVTLSGAGRVLAELETSS